MDTKKADKQSKRKSPEAECYACGHKVVAKAFVRPSGETTYHVPSGWCIYRVGRGGGETTHHLCPACIDSFDQMADPMAAKQQ